jgi:hypothetical protein
MRTRRGFGHRNMRKNPEAESTRPTVTEPNDGTVNIGGVNWGHRAKTAPRGETAVRHRRSVRRD